MLLLLISFLAGMLTILAPCVLPVLPVIVGGSVNSKAKEEFRPYVIAASLAGSIIFFTLLLKVSTLLVNLSPNALTDISGFLVIALGLVALLPELWERSMVALNWEAASQRFLGKNLRRRSRYATPILIGVALGPVFASCSPTYAFILASVLPHSFLSGLLYLVAYSLGLVLTLLLLALAGRKYIGRLGWAINTHSLFRRLIGVLFILIGVVIITGNEVKVETWVANRLPFDESRLEQTLLSSQHKSIAPKLATAGSPRSINSSVFNVQPTPAPEFQDLTNWINSQPLTVAGLKGKVVLVDFWTYSCVNCNRALPYVEKWYQAYHKDGLLVVGVHTPEFAFEHNPTNVQNFVKSAGITYPVALDNNYGTWDAFDNDSWPADYLIDKSGDIRYVALGEGNYDVTEKAIQALLNLNGPLQTPTSNVPISATQTPETYFGSERRSGFSGTAAASPNSDGSYNFTPTDATKLGQNAWTLSGAWLTASQSITSTKAGSTLTFNVQSKDVYVVAGSANNQPETMDVGLPEADAGRYASDDSGGKLVVSDSKLYHIVSLSQFGTTQVKLTVPPGVSLYTFTFGS